MNPKTASSERPVPTCVFSEDRSMVALESYLGEHGHVILWKKFIQDGGHPYVVTVDKTSFTYASIAEAAREHGF